MFKGHLFKCIWRNFFLCCPFSIISIYSYKISFICFEKKISSSSQNTLNNSLRVKYLCTKLRHWRIKLRQLWFICLYYQYSLRRSICSKLSKTCCSLENFKTDCLFFLTVWWKSILKTVVIDWKRGYREHAKTAIIERAFIGFLCNFTILVGCRYGADTCFLYLHTTYI